MDFLIGLFITLTIIYYGVFLFDFFCNSEEYTKQEFQYGLYPFGYVIYAFYKKYKDLKN